MIKNRKIGRFSISRRMINDCPSNVLRCMQNMIVLEAGINPISDKFEYTAINPRLFSVVAIGEVSPKYKIIYNAEKNEVRAEKL